MVKFTGKTSYFNGIYCFLFNGYIMIGKEEQRDGGRLFLLFVTLTIVCCKWVETQGGNL